MTRREFLAAAAAVAVPMRLPAIGPKAAKVAVITDLHHGLAPDALSRLRVFVESVSTRSDLDGVLQLGDFCYSDQGAKECLDLWKTINLPTIHVLGNHDMDKCDKETAMRAWGMPSRYGSKLLGGYRFIWLDLNHFRKDGKLISYANGNYFTDGASHNWADPEQVSWLIRELKSSREPAVILSHQPIGIRDGGKLPAEQAALLNVIRESKAAVCLFGHLHVDRLEHEGDLPCLCVNSASYFWSSGMHPYSDPLYAFMEFGSDGILRIEGRSGTFKNPPPAASNTVIGRAATISGRREWMRGF